MKSYLEQLIGESLTEVSFIHDYVQLGFAGAQRLTINNAYTVQNGELVELIGRKLVEATDLPTEVDLRFEGGTHVVVDLREEAWFSPEALVLSLPRPDGTSEEVFWTS